MGKRMLKVKCRMLFLPVCCLLCLIVCTGCGSNAEKEDIGETTVSAAAESEALQIVSQQEEPQTESEQEAQVQEAELQVQETGAENEAPTQEEPIETGETVEYSYEDIYLSIDLLPDWEYRIKTAEEMAKEDGSSLCAIEFWHKDCPDTVFTFSYETWFGICGTGVTIEEFVWDSGINGYRYTEEIEDTLWLTMTFQNPHEKDEEGTSKGGTYCIMTSPKLSEWDVIEAEFEEIVESIWVGQR
ncbi:MAG: hypothetical protein NC231_08995 [Bacillus sp. (in: Bacteria)]|nr:hypothetical protein [Bacillus sp. (in: firmicutes)]MCM1427563.1 hypothetical protein [Eubacterium sp.]